MIFVARVVIPILLALAAVGAPSDVYGQQSTHAPLSEYFHTAWSRREGAPSEIFALAQTTDGYLWLGSSTGLFRFDGVTFERYAARAGATPAEQNVASLLATPDSSLWVGGIFGGVSRLRGEHIQSYGEREGLPASTVNRLERDATGALLAATGVGLFRLQDSAWHRISGTNGLPDGDIRSMLVDRRGTIWAHIKERGVYSRLAGSARFVTHPMRDGDLYAGSIVESPSGDVWVATQGSVLGPVDARDSIHVPPVVYADKYLTGFVHVDAESTMWVGTTSGFARVAPRGSARDRRIAAVDAFTRRDGLSGDFVVATLTDREGTIWAGTNGGLDRFRLKKLTPVGLPSGVVGPAISPDGSGHLWVGNNSGLPVDIGDSARTVFGAPVGVQALHRDATGQLWVATEIGEVWHATASGFRRDSTPAEARGLPIQSIVHDREGALWISVVRRGVFRRVGSSWTAFGGSPTLPKLTAIRITMDSSGGLWFGYTDNRIARYVRGAVTKFDATDGVDVGNVAAILVDRGHIWIGGARGLQRLINGRFQSVVGRDGTPFRGITGIVECANGDLWLNGADGISLVKIGEWSTSAPRPVEFVRYERFDALDGLDGVAPQLRPLPSVVAGADGKLWFATSQGAYRIDPSNIRRNRVVPPVQLRSVIAAGSKYWPRDSLSLPANTHSLQVQYTALGLAIPERVRFRYQLVGSDTSWQDAGSRREAFYTNLGPGTYRFRVIASNDDGVWNDVGASTVITIPPTFVQSRIFLALSLATGAFVMWVAYRARLRTVSRQLERVYSVRLAERKRIAQDLHDTLLQGFTGITLQLEGVRQGIAAEQSVASVALDRILSDADLALREARHAVWDMQAPELERADLVDALSFAARTAIQGSGLTLHVTVSGARRRFDAAKETALLRIGREAVVNVVQHASAKTVSLIVTFADAFVRLNIADDGRGIDIADADAAARRGHWGIAGMRGRAEQLGGSLQIARRNGVGTEVDVTLPTSAPATQVIRTTTPR